MICHSILWHCRRFDRDLSVSKNHGLCHLGFARTRSKFMLNFWNPFILLLAMKPIFVKLTTRLVPSITHHFFKCLVYSQKLDGIQVTLEIILVKILFSRNIWLNSLIISAKIVAKLKNYHQTWKLWAVAWVECTLTENCRRYTLGCTVPKILIIIPGYKLLNIIAK